MPMATACGSPLLLCNSRRISTIAGRREGRGRLRLGSGPAAHRSSAAPPVAPFCLRFCSSGPPSHPMQDEGDAGGPSHRPLGGCLCGLCGKRSLLGGISSSSLATLLGTPPAAGGEDRGPDFLEERNAATRPSRPGWYKELFARVMSQSMKAYEAEVAGYKTQIFAHLGGEGNKILELGVGTGPNLKYYANAAGVVVGVDPNERMEKYARATAEDAGLPSERFTFVQGVAEALPVKDNSMDAVVGTLVLCSVPDVAAALKEVKRVLKPGGYYIFIEHVAAQEGTFLRFLQRVLDPLQQFVADGCHLSRETGKSISQAGFSDLQMSATSIDVLSIVSPHIYGFACK